MWPPSASRASAAVALLGSDSLASNASRGVAQPLAAEREAHSSSVSAAALEGEEVRLSSSPSSPSSSGEQLLRSRSRQHSSLAWQASPRRPSRSGGASLPLLLRLEPLQQKQRGRWSRPAIGAGFAREQGGRRKTEWVRRRKRRDERERD